MKKNILVILCAFCFLATSAFAQKITLKVGSVAPENSPWSIEQRRLAQEWTKITEGNVNISFMAASALGGENGVIQKMRVSRPGQKAPLDGGIFTNIGVYELAPKSNVLTLCIPFMIRDQNELSLVLDKMSSHINAAVEEQGFVLLGWFNVGWAYFFTKEEVRSPEQLKNISLSVGGITSPELGRAFQYAGYKTDDVPNEKILSSLKSTTGCGGLYTIPMYAYAAQYSKYAPYVLGMPICPVIAGFVVNKKTWESIPEKYKPALLESINNAEKAFVNVQQNNDNAFLQKIEAEGGKIVKLTPSEKSVFELDLYNDALKMTKASEIRIINYDFFQKADAILKAYRAGR